MNLYEILGLNENATKTEIKAAYRRLAKEFHPDIGGDKERFNLINKAHSVLIDDEKRAEYDRTGNTEIVDVRQAAKQNLLQMFNQLLDNKNIVWFSQNNIVNHMKSVIEKNINELEQKVNRLAKDKKKGKLINLLNRVKGKDDELNIFNAILAQRINKIELTIAGMKHEIDNGKAGLGILNEYTDTVKIKSRTYKMEESPMFSLFNDIRGTGNWYHNVGVNKKE